MLASVGRGIFKSAIIVCLFINISWLFSSTKHIFLKYALYTEHILPFYALYVVIFIIFARNKYHAMEKKIIQEIILQQQSFIQKINLQKRDVKIDPAGNYVFVGIRRAGKTYMLYQHIQQLTNEGHDIREMLFVNFEDERISDMRKEDLHTVIDAYRELFDFEPIIFLDEIQNIDGWEHFARRLADEGRRVFITGSNAHMLSREIASTLGGRFLIQEVWPFSFSEYLQFKGLTLDKHWALSPQKADVVRLLGDYFYYGGLAESFYFTDKRLWLTSLYQKVLYSDIVIRKGLRNERSITLLIRKLADSVMQPTAVKRLQNILQGDGSKISRNTIGVYLSYLKEAFLCFSISNFTDSIPQREVMQKHYFYDNGILNLFLINPESKLLENLVAVCLMRKYGDSLFYYNRNVEVDFYVPSKQLGVQVSYSITDMETREREISALVKLNAFKPLKRSLIITYNEERNITVGDQTIEVIPVWKWMLENE